MSALRIGRTTALQKDDDGRVRGIVAGAVYGRLVAQCTADK